MSQLRPHARLLRIDDPDRAFDDPAFPQLARAGWTIGGTALVTVDTPGGPQEPRLLLLLWPPAARTARVDWTHLVVALSAAASAIATVTIAAAALAIAHGIGS